MRRGLVCVRAGSTEERRQGGAVGEVLEVGNEVTRFEVRDIVLTHCNGEPDDYGYPLRIWAYDKADSIGWYSEEAVVGDWQLLSAPLDCGLNLWEIAALPLRTHRVSPLPSRPRYFPRQSRHRQARPPERTEFRRWGR